MLGGVLRNLGWLLGGKSVGGVLSILYLGLAARALGPAGFGHFALVISTGQAVAAVVGFQTWQIVVRYGAPLLREGRQAALANLLAFCLTLDLTASLSGGLLSVPCVWLLARHMGWSGAQARDALIFCLAAVLTVRSAAVGILRLHDRFNLGAAADATTPMIRCAGALIAVATGATVRSFLLAWRRRSSSPRRHTGCSQPARRRRSESSACMAQGTRRATMSASGPSPRPPTLPPRSTCCPGRSW